MYGLQQYLYWVYSCVIFHKIEKCIIDKDTIHYCQLLSVIMLELCIICAFKVFKHWHLIWGLILGFGQDQKCIKTGWNLHQIGKLKVPPLIASWSHHVWIGTRECRKNIIKMQKSAVKMDAKIAILLIWVKIQHTKRMVIKN